MNTFHKYLFLGLMTSALSACSSSDTADVPSDDVPSNDGSIDVNGLTDGGDTSMPIVPSAPSVPGTTPGGSELPTMPGNGTPPAEQGPVTPASGDVSGIDTVTGPLPAVPNGDLYFTSFDVDPEMPVSGGAPTTPKNLRIDLVSNDWAEFSWAPSNDDGEVVEYRVNRVSDGHVYTVRGDRTDPNGGTRKEMDRYWRTTSFIDCNYTRFAERVHDCATNGPEPGEVHTYEVTAVDDLGNESAPSNQITVRYHPFGGSAVSSITDPYGDAVFAQGRDLTTTSGFIDDFELVFEDEFDQGRVNEDFWNTELIWGDGTFINNEQQYFVPLDRVAALGHDPFVFTAPGVTPSTLTLNGVPTPQTVRDRAATEDLLPEGCLTAYSDNGAERCAFLSGALSSHDKFNFLYGYVEGRVKVSGGAGALSSFYLFHRYPGEGTSFQAPEIDILEYLGENPFVTDGGEDAFQNYHFGDTSLFASTNPSETVTRTSPTMSHQAAEGNAHYPNDFHTFGVLWEPQLIVWYIDGVEVRRLSGPQVSRHKMNIVTYLVTGSGWAPTPDITDADLFPLGFELDWIRAYQREAYLRNGVIPAGSPTGS